MTDSTLAISPDSRTALMLDRLSGRHGFAVLDRVACEVFGDGSGLTVLLFAEDPNRVPESWDLSVALPEILKSLPRPWRAGVVVPEEGRALKARYGFKRWPAVVLLRDGGYLGAIEGMHDWREFLEEVHSIIKRSPRRPPSIGVEVVTEGANLCH
jgi:hydrogenase-1 operon protein HyaE